VMASGVRGPTGNDRGSFEHKCRECKSANTMEDHHSGDIVCRDCGLVIGKVIDQGEEWRSFADDDGPDKSRVASRNDLLSESAMSTSIARQQKDGPGGGYSTMSSLQGVASAQDRHLLDQFRKLQRMADQIKIPRLIRERAEEIYKKIYLSKKLRGRKIEGQLAAAMFIACRQLGEPRTFKEIGTTMQCQNKELNKCYKMALQVPGISAGPQAKHADHITRYCARLEIKDYGAIRAAMHVANAVQREHLLVGKNPVSIAGACIYLVGQLSDPTSQRSFDRIAYVTGMAAETIKKAYSEIYLHRLTVVPIDVEDVKWVTTTDLVHAMPPP
jgi:transcription initiation factor TFIIB